MPRDTGLAGVGACPQTRAPDCRTQRLGGWLGTARHGVPLMGASLGGLSLDAGHQEVLSSGLPQRRGRLRLRSPLLGLRSPGLSPRELPSL